MSQAFTFPMRQYRGYTCTAATVSPGSRRAASAPHARRARGATGADDRGDSVVVAAAQIPRGGGERRVCDGVQHGAVSGARRLPVPARATRCVADLTCADMEQ